MALLKPEEALLRMKAGERLRFDGHSKTWRVNNAKVHALFVRGLQRRGEIENDIFGGFRLKDPAHKPEALAKHVYLAPLIADAASLGWTVELKEICEDAETPGVPGGIAGVCCHSRKAIKVRIYQRTVADIKAALEHELRHVRGEEHAGDDHEHGLACGGRANAFGDAKEG